MDSDDTDDEVYEKLQTRRKPEEMVSNIHWSMIFIILYLQISSNYEEYKVHAPPSYLREALEWIATEKEKYEKFDAALNSIEVTEIG